MVAQSMLLKLANKAEKIRYLPLDVFNFAEYSEYSVIAKYD